MIKQITISVQEQDAQKIAEYAKIKDMSISAVYRRGALELIKRESVGVIK